MAVRCAADIVGSLWSVTGHPSLYFNGAFVVIHRSRDSASAPIRPSTKAGVSATPKIASMMQMNSTKSATIQPKPKPLTVAMNCGSGIMVDPPYQFR